MTTQQVQSLNHLEETARRVFSLNLHKLQTSIWILVGLSAVFIYGALDTSAWIFWVFLASIWLWIPGLWYINRSNLKVIYGITQMLRENCVIMVSTSRHTGNICFSAYSNITLHEVADHSQVFLGSMRKEDLTPILPALEQVYKACSRQCAVFGQLF